MHSDSWTSSNGAAYNVHSQEVDLFAWLFQDFLPVFAAGNFGTQLYDGTISAPATAKNCLAVGVLRPCEYVEGTSMGWCSFVAVDVCCDQSGDLKVPDGTAAGRWHASMCCAVLRS